MKFYLEHEHWAIDQLKISNMMFDEKRGKKVYYV